MVWAVGSRVWQVGPVRKVTLVGLVVCSAVMLCIGVLGLLDNERLKWFVSLLRSGALSTVFVLLAFCVVVA